MKGWLTPARALGLGALALLDVALNLALLRQELFSAWVVAPFVVGLALGLVWVATRLVGMAIDPASGRTAYGLNAVAASVVFFGICVILFALARTWGASWDLTREGRRDLAEQTVLALESLTEPVKAYCLFLDSPGSDVAVSADKTRRFLERCRQHTPMLEFEFHDPEAEPEILQKLDLKRPGLEGTIVLESGGRQRVIPVSSATGRLEERDFTNALINLVREARPKVYFLTGHGETDIDDNDPESGATALKTWLEREAYDVERLAFSPADPAIPADCDVLFINGQNRDLTAREVDVLRAYMDQGGRLMLLTDLWLVDRSGGAPVSENLRPWLDKDYGVRIGENVLWSDANRHQVYLVPEFQMVAGADAAGSSFDPEHPITHTLDQNMVMLGVRSVELADELPDGVSGAVLLRTPPIYWPETDLEGVQRNSAATRDPGEEIGSIPVAVAVTKDVAAADGEQARQARLVVVGNRYFAGNKQIRVLSHVNFLMNSLAWLSESEGLIAIRATGSEDPPVVLTPGQEQLLAWVASLGMLHVIVLAGVVVHFRRSRSQ